jgi:protein subunit release factor A
LTAKAILYAKLQEAQQEALQGARNDVRRSQLGKGQRGDKRRSIALQRGQVVDHVLGIRTTAEKYLKGDLSELY